MVNTIAGIEELRSISTEGVSQVFLQFVLEKNSDENEDYLEILRVDASRLEQTRYVQEVQIKKHGRSLASTLVRVEEFRNLAKSVARDGIRRPVLLADVATFELPYRMYRFDGHHRAICAKHLGLERVPAFVFTVTPPESPTPPSSSGRQWCNSRKATSRERVARSPGARS